jgi:hypothetical protein
METEAERNIGFVIRILRYIGWPFAVLFVGMTALGVVLSPVLAFAKEGSIGMAVFIAVAFLPFAAFFVWLLKVAKRMAQRDLTAKSPATIISSLLLLGFPLFTIVGIMCVFKIRRFYDTYCAEQYSTR